MRFVGGRKCSIPALLHFWCWVLDIIYMYIYIYAFIDVCVAFYIKMLQVHVVSYFGIPGPAYMTFHWNWNQNTVCSFQGTALWKYRLRNSGHFVAASFGQLRSIIAPIYAQGRCVCPNAITPGIEQMRHKCTPGVADPLETLDRYLWPLAYPYIHLNERTFVDEYINRLAIRSNLNVCECFL